MNIKLGDNLISLTEKTSLANLLVKHGYTQPHFAVAINKQFVPRTEYALTTINDGDVIDIIMPMQGG